MKPAERELAREIALANHLAIVPYWDRGDNLHFGVWDYSDTVKLVGETEDYESAIEMATKAIGD